MYLVQQIQEIRKYWQKLWWNLANGNVIEMERYQRMEIVEFWGVVDLYEERLQKQIDAAKAKGG